jgi:hypothetical protein
MAWGTRRDGFCTSRARQGPDGNQFAILRPCFEVQIQQIAGVASVSFTSNLLEGSDISAEKDHDVKWSAFSLYLGGADTVCPYNLCY